MYPVPLSGLLIPAKTLSVDATQLSASDLTLNGVFKTDVVCKLPLLLFYFAQVVVGQDYADKKR